MESKKQLYPLKFIPIPSKRVWGGSNLIKKLGKEFYEADENGNERKLTADEAIGESWEIADMGAQDSVVANGWLAGNTISELMETYLDRIVGEDVYGRYGRQFPLLIKFLDIQNKLSVQVHPDDEVAEQRYDSLGKSEIWYVLDAAEGAKVYAGFNREISAQELYDRCHNGTVEEVLNVLHPKKGDAIRIVPGTIHAADGGLLIAEIQELYASGIPIFAVCLGHQLMALATGAQTRKMRFGHRGANHPVKDLDAGRVFITSQNHGYVVTAESVKPEVAQVSHINVNEGSVEGLRYANGNVYTVQFHPEASPGPKDTEYLFDRFVRRMEGGAW